MADLGPGQRPVVMPHYPHLLADDTEVWTKYLESPITEMKRVWYDLHVGKPVKLGPGADETDKKIADGVTKKRIDVVASVGGGLLGHRVKTSRKHGRTGTGFGLFKAI